MAASVKKGSKSDLVLHVQNRLIELDYSPGSVDGVFGEKTDKAVIQFQKSAKLKADGVVGLLTAAALGLDYLFKVPELERRNFKKLLSGNPNYFGNLPESEYDSVSEMSGETKYEEISCVGFNPETDIVTATIQVKLPYGYGGNQCGDGTMEHVRFYIDYGAGDGWEDLGLGGVKVWDLPNAKDCAKAPNKPLSYVVSINIDSKKKFCVTPVLPRIRAILSWELTPAPDTPDWPPIWGNVLEKYIQIKPKPWYSFVPIDYIKPELLPVLEANIKIPELIPIPVPGPPPVLFKEMAALYTSKEFIKKTGTKVEPQRFGHSSLKMISKAALPEQALISNILADWKDLKIDISKVIVALEKTKANVSYEELYCIGLDPNRDWLEATFLVKKPAGYCSGLCKPGSTEYVAFWADWDDTCEWKYLGTAEVNVHDISDIPPEGLNYTAFLPVDLDKLRQDCSLPRIGRIRAVLSWNQPPSTTDPDNLRHYGNRLDTHVQIKPDAPKALIERIGGVSVSQIDYTGNGKTIAGAQMMPSGAFADWWGSGSNLCPFGGRLYIVGKQFSNGRYRLKIRPEGNPADERIIKTKFWITKGLNPPVQISPDPTTGYVNYADVYNNHDDMLGWWATGSNSDMWEIMLERERPDLVIETTPWYKIYLDNIEAEAGITLNSGACVTFIKGDDTEITGKFIATDKHFAGFKLHTMPDSISPPAPETPGTASTSTGSWTIGTTEASGLGLDWRLDVEKMTPCGYVVQVRAYDLTIRSNHSNAHSYNKDDVGFCLREK